MLMELFDRIDSMSPAAVLLVGACLFVASLVCLVLARLAKNSPQDPTWARRRGINGEEY